MIILSFWPISHKQIAFTNLRFSRCFHFLSISFLPRNPYMCCLLLSSSRDSLSLFSIFHPETSALYCVLLLSCFLFLFQSLKRVCEQENTFSFSRRRANHGRNLNRISRYHGHLRRDTLLKIRSRFRRKKYRKT